MDLNSGAPAGWTTGERRVESIPWGALAQPFVFSTTSTPLGTAPASVAEFTVAPTPDGTGASVTLSIIPREPGLSVSFVLPARLAPARSNFPGVVRTDFGLNARHGGPDSRELPYSQSVEEVAPVMVDAIEARCPDVYTRPGARQRVIDYFSSLGAEP